MKLLLHDAEGIYINNCGGGADLEQKPNSHTIRGFADEILMAREKRYYFIQLENR